MSATVKSRRPPPSPLSKDQKEDIPLSPEYSRVSGGGRSGFTVTDAVLSCGFRNDHSDALRLLLTRLAAANPPGPGPDACCCFFSAAAFSRFHRSIGLSTNESTNSLTTPVEVILSTLPPPRHSNCRGLGYGLFSSSWRSRRRRMKMNRQKAAMARATTVVGTTAAAIRGLVSWSLL